MKRELFWHQPTLYCRDYTQSNYCLLPARLDDKSLIHLSLQRSRVRLEQIYLFVNLSEALSHALEDFQQSEANL